MNRLGLQQLLLEPEVLRTVQPDVHLVGMLMSLSRVMPAKAKHTAREVVQRVVHDLEQRLANPLRQAVQGALSRAVRNPRPRYREINWAATIRANLKHYQPTLSTIVPEKLIGYGRRGQALKEIVLCVDQSGSMASSVVYAGVFGAVLASMRAVRTHMVVFDTAVADLTQNLKDPVDLIFGIQLGGGTDINLALTYCQQLITRPTDTILVLISDLYEGGSPNELLKRAAALKAAGVTFVVLLGLSDEGAPSFDRTVAEKLAALGIPSFACTPDKFPELMAAAIQGRDVAQVAQP
ncbi:VWA domain-containing protein [Hymenobacter latericus]|uniref:VWA domain-containing protein n=1 Tax=Hymenobacter sp. YIM 151858-1 TaxID=2987688 RepID=UPI00222782F7|nr:VWA domain-containing protein [Hymenobacter sp. YIM 151858-1]UYZ60005.1 VWA domain-containing protein [Hymenobacter sp. YIM 151858-1]